VPLTPHDDTGIIILKLRQRRFFSRQLEQATYDNMGRGREKAKKPLKADPKDKVQVNFTDEQPLVMPSNHGGFEQSYNAQARVEIDSGLMVTEHVSQAPE
jgi:hypothetical protein